MQNNPSYSKSKLIESIAGLNHRIQKDFIRLKQEFESSQIPNNEISNRLKTWKPILQQSVQDGMNQVKAQWIKNDPSQQFSFSLLVKQLTKTYGNDQQYTEAIRCLNSTTDMIKDYIRIKAIKDPTTAVGQKSFGSSQTMLLDSAKSINP